MIDGTTKHETFIREELGPKSNSILVHDPADVIDDALTSLAVAVKTKKSKASPSIFFGSDLLNTDISSDKDYVGIFPDTKPRDVNYNYDISILNCNVNNASKYRWLAMRLQSLPSQTCKSMKIGHGAYLWIGQLQHDGIIHIEKQIHVWKMGDFWPEIKTTQAWSVRESSSGSSFSSNLLTETIPCDIAPRILLGCHFSHQYVWRVELIEPESKASVKISSDPAGIRDFFTDREKSLSGRRRALKNWVREHWRKKHSIDENEGTNILRSPDAKMKRATILDRLFNARCGGRTHTSFDTGLSRALASAIFKTSASANFANRACLYYISAIYQKLPRFSPLSP